jgi:prepilin-type N-terminal cleavage/methylation domain-containing protein
MRIRAGMTLLEVAVVMGIIALLAALTFPAVQGAREAARAMQCRDNLHQIAIATQNFHATHGRLPNTYRPLRALLPYVDGRALAEALASEPLPTSIPPCPEAYVCPSDELSRRSALHVNYFINEGSAISPPNGVLDETGQARRSFRDLTDGLSTTALYGERLVQIKHDGTYRVDQARRNSLRFVWLTEIGFLPGQERDLAAYCLDANHQMSASLGPFQGADTVGADLGRYNHLIPPTNWSFFNYANYEDHPGIPRYAGPLPPTSRHVGGVHVAMADGGVKFVSAFINLGVWWALGTRAADDVVGDF